MLLRHVKEVETQSDEPWVLSVGLYQRYKNSNSAIRNRCILNTKLVLFLGLPHYVSS